MCIGIHLGIVAEGFMARDITFQNTAGPLGYQAVALRVEGDMVVFYRYGFHEIINCHYFQLKYNYDITKRNITHHYFLKPTLTLLVPKIVFSPTHVIQS